MFKEGKLTLNYITITTLILIGSCIHISSMLSQNTGGIYGKITLNRKEKSFDNVKVQVAETGLSSNVDSSGIFYVQEVPPGEYTLIASAPEFSEGILERVTVISDSISIVFTRLNEARGSTVPKKEIWKGIKIGKVDVQSIGKITGYIKKSETSSPIKAIICIKNTFWVTHTDSLGVYELADILPGKYTIEVFANSEPYRSRTVKNVRVAPDSTSIVDIELGSEFIPEKLPLIEWKENIIRNGNKRRIY